MMRGDATARAAALVAMALGVAGSTGPLWLALCVASHDPVYLLHHHAPVLPGPRLASALAAAWTAADLGPRLLNSLLVSAAASALKLLLAAATAFAVVFFRTGVRTSGFGLVVATLMLPLEVRIAPTFALAANAAGPFDLAGRMMGLDLRLHWTLLDTKLGLMLPLVSAATGTFLLRQAFRALPVELVEAARLDGADPLRFLFDIAAPAVRGHFAALAAVTFISSWNQYLWPLMITTRPQAQTAVLALRGLLPDPQDPAPAWNLTMAGLLIVIVAPLAVAAVFHRWLAKGLGAGAQG